MSLLDRVRYLLPAAILLLVSVFILFYRLGDAPLHDWDEGIYANISAEMVRSGDYLHMKLMGKDWMEKPLLPFWFQAASFKWFGFTEFAARFFPALAGIGVILLLYGIGRRLFSWFVGLWTSLLFALSPLFLDYHMARSADHDVLFLFWFLLALYCYVRSWEDAPAWFVLSGIAAGLSIFTRGALGLFAVLIPLFTHLLLYVKSVVRKQKLAVRYHWYYWVLWASAALIIGGAWHLFAWKIYGQQFVDIYILEQFFSRINGPLQGHTGQWWFYGHYLWKTVPFVTIASALMILFWGGRYAAALAWPKRLQRKHFSASIFLLFSWIVLFGIALMVMQTKLNWYVLGVAPALFLVSGSALAIKGSPRGFATVGVVALLVFYGIQLPHWDETTNEKRAVSDSLYTQETTPLVVYETQNWNFGRALPSWHWYYYYRSNRDVRVITSENRNHYLARDYDQWIVPRGKQDGFEGFERESFGEFELLSR